MNTTAEQVHTTLADGPSAIHEKWGKLSVSRCVNTALELAKATCALVAIDILPEVFKDDWQGHNQLIIPSGATVTRQF